MDTRYEIPPRLRLNRQASSFAATVDDSHFHHTFNYEREVSDEGDDDGSTPRLGIAKMSVDSTFDEPLHFSSQAQAQSTPAPTMTAAAREATPAERLRAVLSRASSLTPTVKTQNVPLERTPSASLLDSDVESDDLETPRHAANGVPATPHSQLSTTSSVTQSVARESVRSIFANALRSPANTPERPRRPRRGSMDSSIVEESPIKWSMLKPSERVKRLSMSDDEKEKMRAATAASEKSFKPSQAKTYDQLRQRLENSSITVETSKSRSVTRSDMSIDMEEATEVEQELFKDREVPIRSTTPPIPSNMTLGQSASQFPSQFLGSNLLTENSDMRRMIEEAQVETTDSEAPEPSHKDNGIAVAESSSEQVTARPALVRQRTLSRNGSVGSLGSSSSRPTSRQSMNDFEDEERRRERERGWNHPLGPYMERHRATSPLYSISQSGGLSRMRRVSLSSISSSESDASRLSPRSAVKIHSNRHVVSPSSSKYAGISSGRLSSTSPNQIRVRTVSQPAKPSSPGSLVGSVNSDKTQKPLDRNRTVSLSAREGFRTSPVIARSHSSSGHGQSDFPRPNFSVSPSSRTLSRSSSQASLRQSEGPGQHAQPPTRERNWNSTRPKWNTGGSPSIASERRRSGDSAQLRTLPLENPSRPGPHGASSSPSSIPRLAVNGRTRTTSHPESGRRRDVNDQKLRDSNPLTNKPTSTSIGGRGTLTIKDKNNGQPGGSKLDHKTRSWREHGPRPVSPTVSSENNETEESEEDGTPKLGQQHIPDSPTPVSGSRPNSRIGTSPGFSSHNNNEGVIAPLPTAASHVEKERQRRDGEQHRITPLRVSMPSEPIELRDSDLDSFQEEDIVASSSAPRLYGGNNLIENDDSSQAEEFPMGINALRPRQDTRLNGHAEDISRKRPVLPEIFSPPLSPHDAQSDPVTLTPQRRTLANSSKLNFRTPSPPKGLPALPDPPSSEEDAGGDKTPPPATVTPANRSRFADMKTPRLPGAWATPFATPAPPAATRANTASRDSHAEKNQVSAKDEIHTPASYSRATPMMMKTPAPPGAWVATPGTAPAKRLQQKVRFDEQEPSAAPAPVPADDDGTLTSDISAVDGSVVMKATGKAKSTSPRTPGRIRVVDAFGNEISHSKGEDRIDKRPVQKAGELHATAQDEKSNSSEGRKSRIRILDAMGREIDEPQVHAAVPLSAVDQPGKQHSKAESKNVGSPSREIGETRLERKQAFQLLQNTIAQLKNDFDEADDPVSALATENIDAQIADLKAQSIRARENRERLLKKISDSTTGVSSRSKAVWNTLLYGRTTVSPLSQGAHLRVFALLVLFQVVVFFAFYHLTSLGARQLFLTTYIDPFYPELYLHVTSPDPLHPSMLSHSNSGLTTSPSSWKYLLLASWHAVLDRILTLKESVWDVWRDPPRGVPWPPT